jgi:tetratricopeptide (TPR) repeat protein
LAYEEAATQLARALPLADLVDSGRRKAAMLVALGEAQHCAGNSAHRLTLLTAGRLALQDGDPGLAARAALANQRPLTIYGAVDGERVALLEAVLGALGPGDTTVRARVLVALASELHHSTDERRHALAREAVAVARRLGDPACLADVLAMAGFALWGPDSLQMRAEMAAELSQLAGKLRDPVLEANAALARHLAAAQGGDLAVARAALSSATVVAEELGQPSIRLRAATAQVAFAILEGRLKDAERFAEDALRFGQSLGNPDCLGPYHAQIGVIRLHEGRAAEFAELVAVAAEEIPLVGVKAVLAWAYADAGRLAEARGLIDRMGGPSLTALPHDYARCACLTVLARACVALGDGELALRLHDELLPYRDQMVVLQSTAFGAVAHGLALVAAFLGRHDEADAHFAFAEALQERSGARGFLIQTRLDWARFLLGRGEPGDDDRARRLAAAAAELSAELDTPVLAQQAQSLLTMHPAAG